MRCRKYVRVELDSLHLQLSRAAVVSLLLMGLLGSGRAADKISQSTIPAKTRRPSKVGYSLDVKTRLLNLSPAQAREMKTVESAVADVVRRRSELGMEEYRRRMSERLKALREAPRRILTPQQHADYLKLSYSPMTEEFKRKMARRSGLRGVKGRGKSGQHRKDSLTDVSRGGKGTE